MKIKIEKDDLQKAISAVEGIVSNRNTLSILSNLLLEADKDELYLTASDLEIGVKAKISAQIDEPGSITIPAKKFSSMIRSMRSGGILFQSDANYKISITSEVNKVKFTIMGAAAKDFPYIVQIPKMELFSLEQQMMKSLIQKTYFAVANDETRYVFNGIFVETKQSKLRFVATDGRRLAFAETELLNPIVISEGMIIPSKAISELQKILTQQGEVLFNFSNNQLFLKISEIEMSCRLIQGKFPDYEKVIPSSPRQSAIIQRGLFEEAVKRVSLMANETSHLIKLVFGVSILTIEAHTQDLGDAHEEIEINYSGDKISIGFNSTYILDVLKEVDDDEIYFKFSDSEMPTIIQGTENQNYLCVIMPLKIN